MVTYVAAFGFCSIFVAWVCLRVRGSIASHLTFVLIISSPLARRTKPARSATMSVTKSRLFDFWMHPHVVVVEMSKRTGPTLEIFESIAVASQTAGTDDTVLEVILTLRELLQLLLFSGSNLLCFGSAHPNCSDVTGCAMHTRMRIVRWQRDSDEKLLTINHFRETEEKQQQQQQ